jgi:hypothetical protein
LNETAKVKLNPIKLLDTPGQLGEIISRLTRHVAGRMPAISQRRVVMR